MKLSAGPLTEPHRAIQGGGKDSARNPQAKGAHAQSLREISALRVFRGTRRATDG